MSGDEGITRRQLGVIAVGAGLSLAPLMAHGAAARPARVRAPAGLFEGEQLGGVQHFRGIRYGRAARFMAPAAEPDTRGTVRAVNWGPSAPQSGKGYDGDIAGVNAGEDCLMLNIVTTGRGDAPKPVMFYIHGGAYSSGTGSSALYDGSQLAERGAVVVTVNHRLNAFGYLYLARFDPRFADSGNAGQLDLILALQWVKRNIAAFGGDPDRIMVFGQSGGGAKIATMMGMPATAGLFHRAATMSGQQVTASGPIHATERSRAYLKAVGVREGDLYALLALPIEKLVEGLGATDPILGGGIYFGPVLDMKWLARHPFWPDANPQSNGIPMMMGNTRDETRAFISPDSARVQGLNWDNLAERMAPELRIDILPEWVVREYRVHFPQLTPIDIFYAATTAGRSWRGQVIEAEARARANAPAWVYQVDFTARTDRRRGAMHTMDIPLVFGTLGSAGSLTGTGADAQAASSAMQSAFFNFASWGDPNGPVVKPWARYTLDTRETMIFDENSHLEADPRAWQRTLFARVPYIQPGT